MSEGNGEAKEQEEVLPEARCWVDKGLLRVEVPLMMPSGEYIAYGMLHKATQLVAAFFRHMDREMQKEAESRARIITPAGMPPLRH